MPVITTELYGNLTASNNVIIWLRSVTGVSNFNSIHGPVTYAGTYLGSFVSSNGFSAVSNVNKFASNVTLTFGVSPFNNLPTVRYSNW